MPAVAVSKTAFGRTLVVADAITGAAADAIAATASFEIARASDFKRHEFQIVTTGTWVCKLERSPDGGTNWIRCSADLTLATTSDTISYLGAPDKLRLVCTRTGGDLTAWVTQSSMDPKAGW